MLDIKQCVKYTIETITHDRYHERIRELKQQKRLSSIQDFLTTDDGRIIVLESTDTCAVKAMFLQALDLEVHDITIEELGIRGLVVKQNQLVNFYPYAEILEKGSWQQTGRKWCLIGSLCAEKFKHDHKVNFISHYHKDASYLILFNEKDAWRFNVDTQELVKTPVLYQRLKPVQITKRENYFFGPGSQVGLNSSKAIVWRYPQTPLKWTVVEHSSYFEVVDLT